MQDFKFIIIIVKFCIFSCRYPTQFLCIEQLLKHIKRQRYRDRNSYEVLPYLYRSGYYARWGHIPQKHDVEKAHQCNMCQAGFDQRPELRLHKIKMHGCAK